MLTPNSRLWSLLFSFARADGGDGGSDGGDAGGGSGAGGNGGGGDDGGSGGDAGRRFSQADMDRVVFSISSGTRQTPIHLAEEIYAPELVPGELTWDDRPWGNGDGKSVAGEQLLVIWKLFNHGRLRTGAIEGALSGQYPVLFSKMEFLNSPVIEAGDSAVLRCRAEVADPGKGWHESGLISAGDRYGTVNSTISMVLDRYFEEFGNGTAHRFPFVNDPDASWIPDREHYSSPGFSMRSGRIRPPLRRRTKTPPLAEIPYFHLNRF